MLATRLHLLCGKIASGKSTLAKSIATEHSAILLSEDQWLSRLYPDEITSVADYVRLAHRIRDIIGPLVIDMLNSGMCVVLDFLPIRSPTASGFAAWLMTRRSSIDCTILMWRTIFALPDCMPATKEPSMTLRLQMRSSG